MWKVRGRMYQNLLTAAVLAICACTDLKSHRIYKKITVGYFLMSVPGHLFAGTFSLPSLAAGVLPGMFCLAVSWITRQSLGYGDSILITVCGVSIGIQKCVAVAVTAFLGAGIWGILLLLFRKADREREIPFVPFLLGGFLLCTWYVPWR